MSTKHREQCADVVNGGELRFGELQDGPLVLVLAEEIEAVKKAA